MDPIAGLLDGPRAHEAFLLRTVMEPPWCVRIQDEAPLTLMAMVEGRAVIVPDEGEPLELGPGDVAIARGPDHYAVADAQGTPPQVVIHPGQRCATPEGEDLEEPMSLGLRTWGNSAEGSHVMLVGTYNLEGEVSRRLLRALPVLLAVRAEDFESPVIPLLAAEIGHDEPGQAAVLDRLLDLLLISVLRAWFARPGGDAPGWYAAHADPVVGAALRMLQENPAHPWTVAELAHAVGASRAALARRFNALVGEPPMAFLTSWRIALAADLLREPGATIGSVAEQVGYGSPFALSTAFKRVHGVSPREHRLRAAA